MVQGGSSEWDRAVPTPGPWGRKGQGTEVLGMVGRVFISVISIIVLLPAACCLPESLVLGLLSLHIN